MFCIPNKSKVSGASHKGSISHYAHDYWSWEDRGGMLQNTGSLSAIDTNVCKKAGGINLNIIKFICYLKKKPSNF